MRTSCASINIAKRITEAINSCEFGELKITIKWSGNREVIVKETRSEQIKIDRIDF